MAATKLSIANGAMRMLKAGLLTLTELNNNTGEAARLFNSIWGDGGVRACLEAGQWRFAKRSQMLDASTSIEPDADVGGYDYVFEKPADLVRLIGIWTDADAMRPIDYREESGFWVADLETIFVTYISDDDHYGGDLSLWPEKFKLYVQAHFASQMAGPLTSEGKEVMQMMPRLLREAVAIDAMSEPTRFAPAGSWVSARAGNRDRR